MKAKITFKEEDPVVPNIGDLFVSKNRLHVILITSVEYEVRGIVVWKDSSSRTTLGKERYLQLPIREERYLQLSSYTKFSGKIELTQ